MSIALTLHLLAAVLWVGGMFFAYTSLRPAVGETLTPPHSLQLWRHTFRRFFKIVWLAVAILPITGYWMVVKIWGGLGNAVLSIHYMHGVGWLMILLFMHVYFASYRKLCRALDREDFASAGEQIGKIRKLVLINTCLGLSVVIVAAMGRYI